MKIANLDSFCKLIHDGPGIYCLQDENGNLIEASQDFLKLTALEGTPIKSHAFRWPESLAFLEISTSSVSRFLTIYKGKESLFTLKEKPISDTNGDFKGRLLRIIKSPPKKYASSLNGFKNLAHKNENIYWKDDSDSYVLCNTKMADTSNSSLDNLLGKTDAELWPTDADKLIYNNARVLKYGEIFHGLEIVNGVIYRSFKKPVYSTYTEKPIGIWGSSVAYN